MDKFIDMFVNSDIYFEEIRKEKILLWGAGSKGVQTLQLLFAINIVPLAIIDSDSQKWGEKLKEIPIISYEDAEKTYMDCTILITTVWTYAEEIKKKLSAWKGKVFACANPFKVETKFLNRNELLDNENDLKESFGLLEDKKSKEIFREVINWKITGDATLPAVYTDKDSILEWFAFENIDCTEKYTYVDVGAYTGDTVVRFMLFSGDQYNKIIAIEPDTNNRNVMVDVLDKLRLNQRVTYIEKGIWREKNNLEFYSSGMDIYESSNFSQDVINMISEKRQKNKDCGITEILPVDTIDNILQEYDEGETGKLLIKIDVQGSEYEALIGAKDTIHNKKPVLILEFATCSKHIGDIIPYLYSLNNKYKFYLRQKLLSGNSRPVLYAI